MLESPKSSSHTTPRFIQFTSLLSTKGCLTQVCDFSAESLQGNMLGVNLAMELCSPKPYSIL